MSGLTIDNPITLANVLASDRVIPGDVLTLLPGTYTGDWVVPFALGGSVNLPVILKPQTPGTVAIDGSIKLNCDYFEIRDIDFTDSRTNREAGANGEVGVYSSRIGTYIYGCVIHDMHCNGVSWFGSGAGSVSENIFLNNGWLYLSDGHGHGLYTHNSLGGAREIGRNLFFSGFGNYAFQIYSGGDNYLRDFTCQDNIICGRPSHTGGGLALWDYVYRRNIQYGQYAQQGRYGYDTPNTNGQILDNTFIELSTYTVNQDCNFAWDNLTESGNQVYGGEPSNRTGYTYNEQPATLIKITPFIKSERWVASVAIYNRDSAATVSVDFVDNIPNGNYKMRNGQNPTETWDFTYSGSPVNVPANIWTSLEIIGAPGESFPTTWPVFGGLVVEKA